MPNSNNQNINVVALVKGEERYIFLFHDETAGEALRTLGVYASNSKLSFSWYDAAVLSGKIRNCEKSSDPHVVPGSNRNTRYRKHLPGPKTEDKVEHGSSCIENSTGFIAWLGHFLRQS